ncbi:MAG: hypothetical protein COZ18_11120 [Flexibacter sp. CG_4_10_14_3_um_filter_32_15]|nr:MAG: hypothetical protein COZ18_11120 [Flexibacter sp. CG_4_10_14_3_um_filter_32_15]
MKIKEVEQNTKIWFEQWILKLNLCPFAHHVHAKKQIRFEIETTKNIHKATEKVIAELNFLENSKKEDLDYIDTTLLVFPNLFNKSNLQGFKDFTKFYLELTMYLEKNNLDVVFQLVMFHPNLVYGGESENAPALFTNRSPYPTLHILREESVTKAGLNHPDVISIPDKNIEKLETLYENHPKAFNWLKSFKK